MAKKKSSELEVQAKRLRKARLKKFTSVAAFYAFLQEKGEGVGKSTLSNAEAGNSIGPKVLGIVHYLGVTPEFILTGETADDKKSLTDWRVAAGYNSVKALHDAIASKRSVSLSRLKKMEAGTEPVTMQAAQALASALKCTPEDLVTESEGTKRPPTSNSGGHSRQTEPAAKSSDCKPKRKRYSQYKPPGLLQGIAYDPKSQQFTAPDGKTVKRVRGGFEVEVTQCYFVSAESMMDHVMPTKK